MDDSLQKTFASALNRHGHGFHAAVARHVRTLRAHVPFAITAEGVEVPVRASGRDTSIDLLLVRPQDRGIYLTVECKRVDPAIGHWCFIRSREHSSESHDNTVRVEVIQYDSLSAPRLRAGQLGHAPDFAHVAVESTAAEKGDGTGKRGRDLDDAVAQAVRGANGLTEWLHSNSQHLRVNQPTAILPAVVTTASLWLSSADLGDADLQTGNLALDVAQLHRVRWLVLQYRVGVGLRHDIRLGPTSASLREQIDMEASRSVLICDPDGLATALSWLGAQYAT